MTSSHHFSKDSEGLCRAIDQRNADQALIRKLERSLEPPQLAWVGKLVVWLPPSVLRKVSEGADGADHSPSAER